MTDKREEILAYLETSLATVEGIVELYRDRGDLTNFQRPAIMLLDGTEDVRTEQAGTNLRSMAPAVYTLRPEIFLIARSRDDMSNTTLNGVAAPIGPELSDWRIKILKKISRDINLVTLLGPNGQVQYMGSETDMRTDNTLEGMILFHFAFSYVLDPAKL